MKKFVCNVENSEGSKKDSNTLLSPSTARRNSESNVERIDYNTKSYSPGANNNIRRIIKEKLKRSNSLDSVETNLDKPLKIMYKDIVENQLSRSTSDHPR